MRNWFITGGTPGGFGMAYADAALEAGDRVVLTARRPEELAEWVAGHGDRAHVVRLDVTAPGEVRRAVAEARERFGEIDVLVNNAGRGWYGSVEGTADDVVRGSFELNFFSVVTVLREVLPGMRARVSGWVVTMSSAAGMDAVPGFGYYSAAKFAVEGLSDALRQEVEPFGIKVLLVEPGAFRTHAYAGFSADPVRETVDAYAPLLDAVRTAFVEQDGRQPGDPARGVRAVLAAMERPDPPHRLVLGGPAFDKVTSKLRRTLDAVRADEAVSRGADFPGSA